jgi:hypothetical protein
MYTKQISNHTCTINVALCESDVKLYLYNI